MSSLRIVPAGLTTSNEPRVISDQATAHSVTGTHDALRHGLTTSAHAVAPNTVSPLQARLQKWQKTQKELQQTLERNTFGLGVPLRREMELKLVSNSPHHPLLNVATTSSLPLGGTHNIALEILQGTDETLDAPDFMAGGGSLGEVLDMTAVMERSRGI
ncbi:hypothetical protein TREMEDRAFT_64276 [Tremella mesenterica DSM 1558]|uniref:uncharacterized protein n=1 Tax=Tremella mesenterica (strain ATCC 24925 / CBS 8224 / DSM 1558 / NBRC 9311 / NRRL Y-6157 / RJB 2259-6 / UBC 559-6) TaxID=578456 RepID=UPI0003F49CE8|nr:uncharacterized protein TREMEDRAFT_64276 [Tremella mesenterica DSM 1558]EIW67682.1 hypothetical protein TREMEDRAFT_64276 [Tremella mesenterica DSM 1558]